MTRVDRFAAWVRLGKAFNDWIRMTDESLLTEVRKELSLVQEASRDECLRLLTLHFVEQYLTR